MLVDGARAEVAAAGKGDSGVTEAAKLRADEIIGGADAAHEGVGGLAVLDVDAGDLQRVGTQTADLRTHVVQNLQQQMHVGDVGDVFNTAGAVDKQGRGQNSNGCIFRAADGNGSVQGLSAPDDILRHIHTLSH